MVKFFAIALALGSLGFLTAGSAHACGGASCGMSAAPGVSQSAGTNRSYFYEPSRGTYGPQMMMRGGSSRGGQRSATAKPLGEYGH